MITRILRALRIGFKIANSSSGSILYIDANNKLAEDNSNLNYDDSGKNVGIGVANPTSALHLPQQNDAVTPTLSFGDGDSGIYEIVSNNLGFAVGGSRVFKVTSAGITMGSAGGRAVLSTSTASSTTPTFTPTESDSNTGVGSAGDDQLSLIAGGKEGQRITETSVGNESLQHTFNGQLGQATGDEIAFKFSYTVNKSTSGADTGLSVEMTDTASPGASKLISLVVGGSDKFHVLSSGTVRTTGGIQDTVNGFLNLQNIVYAASSGSYTGVKIAPTVNQSGTAGLTDLLVNRTETAVGSGDQNLADFQVGGASKFKIDNLGSFHSSERSSDPPDPAEGYYVQWMSDGTGSGDDGDIMVKITAGGTTKTVTLVDFSAA